MTPILTIDVRDQIRHVRIIRPFDQPYEQQLLYEVEENVPHDEGSPFTHVKGLYYRVEKHNRLYGEVLENPASVSARRKVLLDVAENLYRERGEQFGLVKRSIRDVAPALPIDGVSDYQSSTFNIFWQRRNVEPTARTAFRNSSLGLSGKHSTITHDDSNLVLAIWDYT